MFFGKKKRELERKKLEEFEELKKKREQESFNLFRELKNHEKELEDLQKVSLAKYYAYDFEGEKLTENEDYIVCERNYIKYTLFLDKEKQPYYFKRNDLKLCYEVHSFSKGKVIKVIRQQRTSGSLDGKSSAHFKHNSRGGLFGGSSVEYSSHGFINGSLDTKDEFIVVIRCNNKNLELRVDDNFFYSFSEGDEIWIDEFKWVHEEEMNFEEVPYEKESKIYEYALKAKVAIREAMDNCRDSSEKFNKYLSEYHKKYKELPIFLKDNNEAIFWR